MTKWDMRFNVLFLWILLLFVGVGAGCAGQKPHVGNESVDEPVKTETPPMNIPGKERERPPDKILRDETGNYRLIPTPFGYLKREIRQAEESPKSPSLTPEKSNVSTPSTTGGAPLQARKPEERKEVEERGRIIFNFDDADLYEVIRTTAELLNINYIIDPNIRGKVTIHTAGKLERKDLFPVFFQILEVNGLTAVKEGALYRIIRVKEAPRMSITSRLGSEGEEPRSGEGVIIQIIPLEFIAASEMSKLLNPFISDGGALISQGDSNTLLVVDKGWNIMKIMKLIKVFDVDLFDRVNHRIYTLKYMDAEEMDTTLRQIFAAYKASLREEVRFIPIGRLNALLVISRDPRVFETIDGFVRQFDIPSEDVEPRIYVYSVKNGEASELAGVLNQVFPNSATKEETVFVARAEKEDEGPPPPRNPFARRPEQAGKPERTESRATGEAAGSGTLRGEIKITSDEIRNSLIIEAIPADFRVIEQILDRIDVLPRQVLIEVTIAEITLDESTRLGIEWSYLKGPGSMHTSLLEASIGSSGLQYTIGQADRWTSVLAALASDNKVNILSAPSVLASDNKEARIDISTEIPVSSAETTTTGDTPVTTTTIQYRDTGVILSVTPHINERRLVTMDVSQEVSEQSTNVQVGEQDYPSFYKRNVNTTLTVKHGQTIVIGGLIKETRSDGAAGAPWLVDIPVIRYLFGKETKTLTKTELIILITPHVIVSLEDIDSVTEEFKNRARSITQSSK